ncbi:MAG: heme o synthase [bacterium]
MMGKNKFLSQLLDYYELTKPGVTFMVLLSTLAGFYLGSQKSLDFILLVNTILGTCFVAGGTNALNQLLEREIDARMKRTRKRPLPAGRLQPSQAQFFGSIISLVGILYLCLTVNLLTGLLATLTLGSYVFLYTPMKRKTSLSTVIGAISGAIPPMGGWAAARGDIGVEAWVLFAILFFWQIPHFLAIAWVYRADYIRGKFPVLPVIDGNGALTSMHIIVHCLALLSVSLLPTLLGLTGRFYFVGALLLGLGYLASGVRVAILRSNFCARRLLQASIIYLPVLLALMSIDKIGL